MSPTPQIERDATMTIRYEFQGIAFRSEADMLAAIAREWLSAGGLNSEAQQSQFLADDADDALAAECIEAWGLNQGDDETKSHMEFNNYSAADLAAAFGDLR